MGKYKVGIDVGSTTNKITAVKVDGYLSTENNLRTGGLWT